MITLNGIVGLCLLSGGVRYHESGFQARAATSALAVLGTVAVLALILPNFTLAEPGPVYATPQLIFVAVVALGLYGLFLYVQTISHRSDFLDEVTPMPVAGPPTGGRLLARSSCCPSRCWRWCCLPNPSPIRWRWPWPGPACPMRWWVSPSRWWC